MKNSQMKITKYHKIIMLVVILLSVILCSNSIFATSEDFKEDWDTFYQRFQKEAMTADGKNDNLTDADLQRMINGPTQEERYSRSSFYRSGGYATIKR